MTRRLVAAIAAAMFGLGILAAMGGAALAGTPANAAPDARMDACISMMGGSGAMGPMMGGSGAMGPQAMPDPSAMPGPGHDLHHPSGSPTAESVR